MVPNVPVSKTCHAILYYVKIKFGGKIKLQHKVNVFSPFFNYKKRKNEMKTDSSVYDGKKGRNPNVNREGETRRRQNRLGQGNSFFPLDQDFIFRSQGLVI